jgi:hypothetical protein
MGAAAVTPRDASLRAPVLVGTGGLVLAAALLARDPHTTGSWPPCPFLALTGVPCPACGGLRAVHDLLAGDVPAALSSNAWAVLTTVLCLGAYAAWLVTRVGAGSPTPSGAVRVATTATAWMSRRATVLAAAWGVGLVAFGALRLLPALSVLRP